MAGSRGLLIAGEERPSSSGGTEQDINSYAAETYLEVAAATAAEGRAPCGRRRQAGVPRALAATAQKAHRSPRPEFIPGTASSTRKFLTQKSGL
jgi:hypothetical protein